MSARSWRYLSWVWLVLAFVWMALDASVEAKFGTLMAAIVARGISDILQAIEARSPAPKPEKPTRN